MWDTIILVFGGYISFQHIFWNNDETKSWKQNLFFAKPRVTTKSFKDFFLLLFHVTVIINIWVKMSCYSPISWLRFIPTNFLGPYNCGYLAALRFLCGCCEIRQPGSKNNKINLDLIFASRSSYLATTTPGIFHLILQPGYMTAAIQK